MKTPEEKSLLNNTDDTDLSNASTSFGDPKPEFSLWLAIKEITESSIPNCINHILRLVIQTINLIFVGHILSGQERIDALNGLGMSHLYYNCLVKVTVMGMFTALPTLGSNAYGAGKLRLLGIYLQRTQIIAYIVGILLLIIHYFLANPLILLTKIDSRVFFHFNSYFFIFYFSVLFETQGMAGFVFNNIIEKSYVNLINMVITVSLHPLWCYINLYKFNMGTQGLAISMLITFFILALLNTIYIYVIKPVPDAVFCICKESFEGWGEQFKLIIPGCILQTAELCVFEIISFIMISISKFDYTIYLITSNIYNYSLNFICGFRHSIINKTAKEIGMGNIQNIKKMAITIITYGILCVYLIGVMVAIFRRQLIGMINDDIETIQKSLPVLLFIAFSSSIDCLQGLLTSLCRGLRQFVIPTVITCIGWYGLTISLAYLLGKYLSYGVIGVWIAITTSNAAMCICLLLLLSTLDLEYIRDEALLKLEEERKEKISELIRQDDKF